MTDTLITNTSKAMYELPTPGVPGFVVAFDYWFRPEAFNRRCETLGDRFALRLPGLPPVVCITHPDDMRAVFAGDQSTLHHGEGISKLSPHELVVGIESISLKDGDAHLRDRRIVGPHFSHASIKKYAPVFRIQAQQAIGTWPVDRPFSSHQAMMNLALNIIVEVVFGVTNVERAVRLREAMLELLGLASSTKFLLSTIVAVSRGGDWSGADKWMKIARDRVDAVVKEEMEERCQTNSIDRDDLLAVFMKIHIESPERMSEAALFDAMRTMLAGGYETTASTLAWIFERLVRHKDVIERLEHAVFNDDDEYIDAVITEGMRTRPNLPHTVRYVVKPFKLGEDLTLQPGTLILPMMYLCHHQPDIYPDPCIFNPERFVGKKASQYELINFGGGLRRCLGAPFAMLEMKEILRAVVQERRVLWTPARNEKVKRVHINLVPDKGGLITLSKRT